MLPNLNHRQVGNKFYNGQEKNMNHDHNLNINLKLNKSKINSSIVRNNGLYSSLLPSSNTFEQTLYNVYLLIHLQNDSFFKRKRSNSKLSSHNDILNNQWRKNPNSVHKISKKPNTINNIANLSNKKHKIKLRKDHNNLMNATTLDITMPITTNACLSRNNNFSKTNSMFPSSVSSKNYKRTSKKEKEITSIYSTLNITRSVT